MMRVGFISILILGLWVADEASAQLRIIPREKLEAVASPRLSRDSSALDFDTRHIVAESMNEDDAPATFRYMVRNVSEAPLSILSLKTTCSCVTAFCGKDVLQAGEDAEIIVRYDPKGHPGRFERRIFVYTQTGNSPAAILKLTVDVESSSDLSRQYQVLMGCIALRGSAVSFDRDRKSVETLRFINLSGKPLRLECEEMFLPDCISFATRPQVLEAGQEGEIVISYTPAGKAPESVVPLILKGLGVPPSRSTINITIEQ